jgi:deoxyribonuclease V
MPSSPFDEFRRIQEQLRSLVRVEPLERDPNAVAAVDLHVGRDGVGFGAAVLVAADGNVLEQQVVRREIDVPYVPGFLSFREMPICRAAIQALRQQPDVLMVDGQGIAHPRRFGLACHLGVELDLPAIGVAKSLLVGKRSDPGNERGSTASLRIGDEVVGMSVRTRTGVRPVYVSVGHRITLEQAVQLTLRYTTGFRLPDPSRLAHKLAREAASNDRSASA